MDSDTTKRPVGLSVEIAPGARVRVVLTTPSGRLHWVDEIRAASARAREMAWERFADFCKRNGVDVDGAVQREFEAALIDAAERLPAGNDDVNKFVLPPDPEPWPDPVDGTVLDEVAEFIRRFVVIGEHELTAVVLWTAFTHCVDLFDVAPLLAVTSPTKSCGKTTLLEVMADLVPRPLPVSNISTASVFRSISRSRPTLLLDEADTFFESDPQLRGVFNAGHRRRFAFVVRADGDPPEPRLFWVWGAKALARIGEFPPTITSRSVVVRLQKKLPTEKVDRYHPGGEEAQRLHRRLARWARDIQEQGVPEPPLPDQLGNREADNWSPLIALAYAAGGPWPARAVAAAVAITREPTATAELGVQLLSDISTILSPEVEFIPTQEILNRLNAMEEAPWPTLSRGRPMTAKTLAQLLRRFGVRSVKKPGGERGYRTAELAAAIARYAPPQSTAPSAGEDDSAGSYPTSDLEDAAANSRYEALFPPEAVDLL